MATQLSLGTSGLDHLRTSKRDENGLKKNSTLCIVIYALELTGVRSFSEKKNFQIPLIFLGAIDKLLYGLGHHVD